METGMLPLPEGKMHDFDGTTYIQILVVTLFSVTFAFATAVLILRIYTAIRIVKHPDLSDREHNLILSVVVGWAARHSSGTSQLTVDSPAVPITVAWGLSIACFAGMVISMPYGLGRHLWNVTAEQLAEYYKISPKYTLLIYLTYIWTPILSKLAILVLYRQINPFRPFRVCVYITAAGIIIYTVIFTSLLCGLCKPAVYRVVVASILRVPFLSRMTMSSDVTWAQASLAIWSSIELNFGIACNCMARLRPFVRAHMPKLMRYLDDHKNGHDARRPGLAVAAPAREHGGPNAGDDDGEETWRCQEHAVYTFRLHSFEGKAQPNVDDESGHIHVRREVTVDLEPIEAASRRMRSTDKLIRH
ncbi:hypothetical protein PG985_005095 [Apiospora marii]|uniref:Rhodopsin domain-containing protein n=1 Tax=Apiospora marii TaxID=335849 RepID=A0ABR1SB14_9PEZI